MCRQYIYKHVYKLCASPISPIWAIWCMAELILVRLGNLTLNKVYWVTLLRIDPSISNKYFSTRSIEWPCWELIDRSQIGIPQQGLLIDLVENFSFRSQQGIFLVEIAWLGPPAYFSWNSWITKYLFRCTTNHLHHF